MDDDNTRAAAAVPAPARLDPVLGADGQPLERDPPCGGRWRRDADGGLTPHLSARLSRFVG